MCVTWVTASWVDYIGICIRPIFVVNGQVNHNSKPQSPFTTSRLPPATTVILGHRRSFVYIVHDVNNIIYILVLRDILLQCTLSTCLIRLKHITQVGFQFFVFPTQCRPFLFNIFFFEKIGGWIRPTAVPGGFCFTSFPCKFRYHTFRFIIFWYYKHQTNVTTYELYFLLTTTQHYTYWQLNS